MPLRIPKARKKPKPKFRKRALVSRMKKGYIATKAKKREELRAIPAEGIEIPVAVPVPAVAPPPLPEEEARLIEAKPEGVEIVTELKPTGKPVMFEEREPLRGLNVYYPLIPRYPKKGEFVYAYANLKWDPKKNEVVYYLIEPTIAEPDKELISRLKEELEERLDIDVGKLGTVRAKEILREEINKAMTTLAPKLEEEKKRAITYYVERDTIGLGRIQGLIVDPNIEDLSCDGVGVPLYVYHRDPRFGSVKTNVAFANAEELNSFVIKLAQKCKKTISIAEPLLDGALPDGSRVQATLGTDIARKGSNFTIRKFTEKPLTPTHILRYKTLDSLQLAYLWLAVENGMSILVSGGTATGKTALLNALSLFIRPSMKVVSIEDTAELRLALPHWIPHVARTPLAIKGRVGEVTLFDLLKSSLRQRPDYLVLGEVRGKEAFVLFQQIASIPGEEKVLVLNGNNLKRVPISQVTNNRQHKVPTIDPDTGKIQMQPLQAQVEHFPVTELYKITTKSGREVVTKGSHSVFTHSDSIRPVTVSTLKKGDDILIPAKLPVGYNDLEYLNLIELLPNIRVYAPSLIKKASRKLSFEKASRVAGFTTISNYYGINNCALPARAFKKLMDAAEINYSLDDVQVRFERGASPKTGARLEVSPELLRFLGYHMSEGSINRTERNYSMALYNKDPEVLTDMRHCIKTICGKAPRERETHGFGTATELQFNHKTLFELIKTHCGTKSDNLRIPDLIFGLSKEKIGQFLSGLYSGDSTMRSDRFVYYTTSRELANDLALLLLVFGIVCRIRKRKRAGRKTIDYEIKFCRERDKKEFLKYVHPVGKSVGVIKGGRPNPYLKGDVFIDKVREIEKIHLNKPVPVYDLSVPGTQNFIGGFGGILLHNTGHPAMATIHAATIPQLIDRLITPPISLPPTLLENVDVVVFLTLSRLKGVYVRRADTILEVTGTKKNMPVTNKVFEWKPVTDTFEIAGDSVALKKIAKKSGITDEAIKAELLRRKLVLEWMLEQGILDYKEVAKVISAYYSNPDRIMDMVTGT